MEKRVVKKIFATIGKILPYLAIAAFLIFLYRDVVFFGKTLETSQSVAGVMPSGQYGYPEEKVHGVTARDPGASAWQYVPLFELSLDEYRQGRLPLWNPYSGLGAPLAGNMQSSAFFLPQLIIAALQGFDFHWDFYLLLRLFFAGIFTFLFCRKIGLMRLSSLLASLFFMGNGYFLFYVNMSHLNVETLLPFFLWTIESFRQQPRSSLRFLLIVLATHLLITGGFPKATFFALAFGALYMLFRFFYKSKVSVITPNEKPWFSSTLFAMILGIFLSAFLLLPFFEYIKNSAHVHTSEVSKSILFYPLDALKTLFFPKTFGNLPETWVNPEPMLPFLSFLVWPLTILAFFHKKYRAFSVFFAAVALFYLLKAFGFPLVQWIQDLPILKLENYPKYLFVEFAFVLSLLAGFGFEYLSRLFGKWRIMVFGGLVTLLLIETSSLYWFPRNQRYDTFTKPPYMVFLQEKQKNAFPFRIFSPENYLVPNVASAFRVSDIRSNDALYPKGFYNFLQIISPDIYDRFTGKEENLPGIASGLWDFLNIRYFIVSPETKQPGRKTPWPLVYQGNDAWIYENPTYRERSYFLNEKVEMDPRAEVKIEEYKPLEVRIRVNTPVKGLLIFTDLPYPGFQAFLDSKRVPIEKSHFVFRAVSVTEGSHTVSFVYQPTSYRVGFLISLFTLVGSIIYARIGVRKKSLKIYGENSPH